MSWLERKFGKFAVPHLTLGMVILIAVVTGADLAFELGLGQITLFSLFDGNWTKVPFYPFHWSVGNFFGMGPWVALIIFLYFFWLFGSMLEALMGDFRYNLFMALGVLATFLGTPFGTSIEFVDLSILLGIATLNPNLRILLLFVIPVKIKWVAIVIVTIMLFFVLHTAFVGGMFLVLLMPVLGLLNYLIFFLPGLIRGRAIQPIKRAQRNKERVRQQSTPIHRCTVCGQTELDNPQLEFRYCVECEDHEYCLGHLHNHEHI
ncbi:MAG: hypothetical protein KDK23_06595 [Leptospiraceae bacterium]|nr:hypothetical protein [Leptospiraceae bacterium]